MVTRHNQLRDVFVDFCHQAHLGVPVEVGSNLTPDGSRSRPADVLVRDWITGRFAAFDSSLLPHLIKHASHQALQLYQQKPASTRLMIPNICSELGWVCIPLAVETYENWRKEARDTFSHLATLLAIESPKSKSSFVYEIYSRLNLSLPRFIVRAIMARTLVS